MIGVANSKGNSPKLQDGFSVLTMVNWNDLKVFLTVAAAGSLAGAARRLGLSQATVWRRITALDGVQRRIETAGHGLARQPEGA